MLKLVLLGVFWVALLAGGGGIAWIVAGVLFVLVLVDLIVGASRPRRLRTAPKGRRRPRTRNGSCR